MQRVALGLAASLLLAACADPEGAPYDCTVQAVRAQTELPAGRWSRLLMAQYHDVAMGHTYMVFDSPDGHLFAYDSVFGSRPIFPRSREAKDVAAAVDPRAETAWFVEDTSRRRPCGWPGGKQTTVAAAAAAAKTKPAAIVPRTARDGVDRQGPPAKPKELLAAVQQPAIPAP